MKSLALLCALPYAWPSHATCTRTAVDLPVVMTDNKAVVAAKINDTEVRFFIDSGAFFSHITQATVDEFKLRTRNAPPGLRVSGIGGVSIPVLATVKAFSLKNVTMTDVEFLVTGGHFGAGVNGILGQNLFQDRDVEYNLAEGLIRVMKDFDCSNAMLAYWVKPGDPVSAVDIDRITPQYPHITGAVLVNGVKLRVTFDSGASLSMLTRSAAERVGIKLDGPEVVDAGLVLGIGSAAVKSYVVPISSFRFEDGEEIKHTRLRVADVDLGFTDMLLGADFFLSHRLFVAQSQKRVYFTYNGGPVFNLANTSAAPQGAAQPAEQLTDPQHEPADAAAWARRGMAFAGRHQFDRALADLTRAGELEPANPEYSFERGRIYLQKNDPNDALADFDRALALQPDHVQALMSRAELRIHGNDIAGARTDLDVIDKTAASQAEVRFDMALAYEDARLMSSAIKQADLWISSHEEDSMLPVALRARCRARAVIGKDLPLAVKDCDRAVAGSTKGANPLIMESRGFLFLRLGNYDKAIADYDAAIKINPQFAMALYGRGIAEMKTKKIAQGESDIANAEKLRPKIADVFREDGITP
jgi:tetratricopeptide (TPR) repeat protein